MPRIIAGTAGGVPLQTPEGQDTRPTADSRKEAIFSRIQFEVPESRFLDLFSGSGAAGLEALSRGAAEAVLVESDAKAVRCIRANLQKTGLSGARVIQSDVMAALDSLAAAGEIFDIIFLDPPYRREYEEKVLHKVQESGLLADGGLLVVESAADTEIPVPQGFILEKTKAYRVTRFTLLRRKRSQT